MDFCCTVKITLDPGSINSYILPAYMPKSKQTRARVLPYIRLFASWTIFEYRFTNDP